MCLSFLVPAPVILIEIEIRMNGAHGLKVHGLRNLKVIDWGNNLSVLWFFYKKYLIENYKNYSILLIEISTIYGYSSTAHFKNYWI